MVRTTISDEHTLEFLLGFDGRIHYLAQGYWLKFEIKRADPTPQRPHGLRYSFTLHDPNGDRLLGFDNAHGIAPRGARYRQSNVAHDHWHRTADDAGRPYPFTTAEQLLVDFEAEVGRVLAERGVGVDVVETGNKPERRS